MNLIRLGDRRNAVQHAKICRSHPCVSCTVVDLGVRTKCRYFSELHANNCVLEKYKNKIKLSLGPVVLTGRILPKDSCRQVYL